MQWSNRACILLTESAANTLTFIEMNFGAGLLEKVGLVIHKIQYLLGPLVLGYFNGTGDYLTLSITLSDQITTLAPTNANVVDMIRIQRTDLGTAASGDFQSLELERDFTGLPGGGIVIAPNPVFGAVAGTGLSTAASCYVKIFYTPVELKEQEYWALVGATRLVG